MHSNKGKSGRFEGNCSVLAVFTFLYAWATLFEIGSDITHLSHFPAFSLTSLLGHAYILLPIWTILKPSSLFRSVPFFVCYLISIIYRLPLVPNHIFFESLISITILACFIYSVIIERSNFTKTKFYELFAPALRLELIILYFWTAFHKINTGFLNYKISCATVLLLNNKEIIPFLPIPDWFIFINPYLTILIEGLIPILLIIPKTRIYGLILAICFHFILGFEFPGFTVFVYSLLSLFIPSSSYDRIKTSVDELKDKISGPFSSIIHYKDWTKTRFGNLTANVALILLIFFILRFFFKGSDKTDFFLTREGLYLIFCITLVILFFYFVVIRLKELKINERLVFIPKKKWLLILPAIVFLNGLLPHIGLKNIHVFAMFSNLQTEGGKTNHLLIPSSFQLFNNLKDLVSIKASNHKTLNELSGYVSRGINPVTTVVISKPYVKYMKNKNEEFKTKFKYKIPFAMLQIIVTDLAKKGIRNIELVYERGVKLFIPKMPSLTPF